MKKNIQQKYFLVKQEKKKEKKKEKRKEKTKERDNCIPASARLISPKGTLVQTPRSNLCRAALADASSKPLL